MVFWLPLASGNCLGPAPCFGLPYAGERAGEQNQLRLQHSFPCITRLISSCCAFRAATHPMLLLTSCKEAGPAEAGCTSSSLLTATRIRRLVSIRMGFIRPRMMCGRAGPAEAGCASAGLLAVTYIKWLVSIRSATMVSAWMEIRSS